MIGIRTQTVKRKMSFRKQCYYKACFLFHSAGILVRPYFSLLPIPLFQCLMSLSSFKTIDICFYFAFPLSLVRIPLDTEVLPLWTSVEIVFKLGYTLTVCTMQNVLLSIVTVLGKCARERVYLCRYVSISHFF